jgi:hypothetical protein
MVILMQTERTYNVSIPEGEFTATLMEDWDSTEVNWEIWDESGNIVSGKRALAVIAEIEKILE